MEYLLDRKGERGWPRTSTDWGSLANGAATSVVATYGLGVDGRTESGKHGADGGRAHCPNPEGVNAATSGLTYFTRGAEWSDRDVRREAAALRAGGDDGSGACNGTGIIDDTGFPKQGTHSVGVQRQYSAQSARSPIARWRPA